VYMLYVRYVEPEPEPEPEPSTGNAGSAFARHLARGLEPQVFGSRSRASMYCTLCMYLGTYHHL
jgi:hypothetical protein